MAELEDVAAEGAEGAASDNGAPPAADTDWRRDKRGKEYVIRGGGHAGIIYRQGQETPEEARARVDAAATDKLRPGRGKPKSKPKMPEAPRKIESKELEESLAAALKAPGAIAMSLSPDDWLPEHFNTSGPYLARHIVLASEHNPWLRRRLEEAAQGQDAMWAVISLIGVGGAVFAYAVPPVIYLFNLPVSENVRARWGMPPREPRPPYAGPPSPETPEPQPTGAF